jgi:flagellar motor switch protein FliG
MMLLTPELREEVVERLGGMEETSRDVVKKIAKNLNRNSDTRIPKPSMHRSGGVKAAADILNMLDKESRKTLLARIEERNAPLGAAIRKKLFGFEDLSQLAPTDMQRLMREVDMNDMAKALKAAKPALVDAILKSISKRAAEGLREEIEMLGALKAKDVEAAQDRIIAVVRKLEESEEITLDNGGEERAFV